MHPTLLTWQGEGLGGCLNWSCSVKCQLTSDRNERGHRTTGTRRRAPGLGSLR